MSKKFHILGVDDNAMNRSVLERILGRQGYTITSASGGKEALERLKYTQYDLVLLDIMMPDVDGLEVLKSIRERYSMSEMPVIMVSALDDNEKIVELLDLGANDYITKPIDNKVLQARVNTQLELAQAHKLIAGLSEDVKRRNKLLVNLFGRYVSDDVALNLVASPGASEIGSELAEITLLFADIRGFSELTTSHTPEQVLTLLNNFYDVMIDVVGEFKGTIDKLMGDEMLVTFGVPKTRDDDIERALACALNMQLAVEEVNKRNEALRLPAISIGIGVNTGEVMVGNIGSSKHASYSVIGKEVNLTSAIESNAKGGEVLISESTFMGGGLEVWVEEKRELHPNGFSHGVMTYKLIGIDGKYKIDLDKAV